MEQQLRIRLAGVDGSDWGDSFKAELNQLSERGAVELLDVKSSKDRLGQWDPTVLVAIVTGGAAVLSSVITAAAAIYVARLQKNKTETDPKVSVNVILHGSKDSAVTVVDPSVALAAEQIHALLGQVGQLREIEIAEE